MIKQVDILNLDRDRFYYNIKCYTTTTDKHETDYYMLVEERHRIDEVCYRYVIRQGYQSGTDAWGWDYVCNAEDLYDIVEKYKDSTHPFVENVKGYLKKLENDKTLTLI